VLWKGWLTDSLLPPIHPMLSGCDVLLQLVSASWPDLSMMTLQTQWISHQVCEHCQVGWTGVRVWTQPMPERLMVPASEHSVSPDLIIIIVHAIIVRSVCPIDGSNSSHTAMHSAVLLP